MSVDRALGSRLPSVPVPPPGPASRALAGRLARVESRNVTFVSHDWPVFWDEASGTNVRDADGNVFIDLTAAFGVALLGHSSRLVRAAIARQAERVIHGMGDIHPPTAKLELLERLCALMPWPESRAVLSSTGSEAVETALKTTHMATGKPGVLAFEGGYHGLTLGSLAVTERAHFRGPFVRRAYGGVAFAPFPDTRSDGADAGAEALERIREMLRVGAPNGDPIGAVIIEPVQARGGARIAPHGFMAELCDLAHDADALVVADEIMTGLGRCGAVLASERVGLRPDVVCLGKALGGGLPLSACVAGADVMDAWPVSEGEAMHTSTFLGHPLACAVGSDFLDLVATGDVCERAEREGSRLLEALRDELAQADGVASVRGIGLLLGIEFGRGGSRLAGAGAATAREALGRGLIALPAGDDGHVLELTPPLGLTEEQTVFVARELSAAIRGALEPAGHGA